MATGIHTCCPAPVGTVNVVQNIVEVDGSTGLFRDEYFTGDGVTKNFTLETVPYDVASVQVALNSGVQRRNVDWILYNDEVRFMVAPPSGAPVHIRYFAVSGVSTLQSATIPTGTMVGYSGATPPDGYVFMDGVTELDKTEYAELFSYATTHSLVLSTTSTTFILKNIQMTFFDAAANAPVTGSAIIKT